MARKRTLLSWLCAVAIVAAAVQGCSHKAKSPRQQADADYLAYQKKIREVVKDPARADQMVALADEMQQQVDQVRARLVQNRAKLAALNSNYNGTRADFDAFFKQDDADREALMSKAVSVRVRIGKLLTESEWQQLHKYGAETLSADLKELAL